QEQHSLVDEPAHVAAGDCLAEAEGVLCGVLGDHVHEVSDEAHPQHPEGDEEGGAAAPEPLTHLAGEDGIQREAHSASSSWVSCRNSSSSPAASTLHS